MSSRPCLNSVNDFTLNLKQTFSVASRALWDLSPLPPSSSLLSSPIFSTHLHLSHAHHFFNSSDSPGSFSPQGLCIYTLYFLESCSLHSQAPILKPGCFLLIISGFTKLFSFQWGHPWHSKLVAGIFFFFPTKGPDLKYVHLCRPKSLCLTYLTLPL